MRAAHEDMPLLDNQNPPEGVAREEGDPLSGFDNPYGYAGGGHEYSPGLLRSHDDGFSYYSARRFGMFGGMYNDSNYVFVDAHVLSSPTIADVNGDGHMEVGFLL